MDTERKYTHTQTHDTEQWNADLPNDNRMRQSVKAMETKTKMKKKEKKKSK